MVELRTLYVAFCNLRDMRGSSVYSLLINICRKIKYQHLYDFYRVSRYCIPTYSGLLRPPHHSASHYITLHHTTSPSHYITHPSSSIIIIIIHHSALHYTTLHHTTSLCITLHLHHITSAPKALESRQRRNTTRLRRNKSQMDTN